MTMDEMVVEVLRLHEALMGEPSREMVQVYVGKSGASARIVGRDYTAVALDKPSAFDAVSALHDKLRAEAAVSASKHEARASALRAALGVPSPAMAVDDLRAAVREWWAARRGLDHAAQVTTSIADASEAITRFEYAEATLRDAMGGEL